MVTFLMIIHVIVCLAVVLVVLLQQGKGASVGATFGTGGSQTVFGSRGAGNFLTKLTAAAGAIFMITSLALAILESHGTSASIVKDAFRECGDGSLHRRSTGPGAERRQISRYFSFAERKAAKRKLDSLKVFGVTFLLKR